MSLYDKLCVVRTSIVNVIGQSLFTNKQPNMGALLESIAEEISELDDFVEEVLNMTEEELLDLGFAYLNDETDFMLIPVWLFPFIPYGTELIDKDDNIFVLEDDTPPDLHGDSWLNAGLYLAGVDI